MNKKSFTLPMLVALLGVLVMIVSVFLPYLTATDAPNGASEWSESLYGEDITSFSMFSFASFCEQIPYFSGMGIVMYVLLGVLGLFVLMALLFVLLKKPIPVTVFAVLSVGMFFLYSAMFNTESNVYSWGIGYYTYLIAAAVAVAGSIWLKVAKVKANKQTV